MADERAAEAEEKRARQKEKEEKWVDSQIIGFTAWINSFLNRRKLNVENLQEDFKDGIKLVNFLELAAGHDTVLGGIDYKPKGKIQMIQNLSIALKFIQEDLEVRLLGINPGTVYEGNLKMILGMVWSIFRSPKITQLGSAEDGEDGSKAGKASFETQLLAWVRERVAPYGIEVNDFKKGFNNGMAFGALVHSIDGECVKFEDFSEDKPADNLNTAFDAAVDSFQVPKLLSVDDMTSGNADERSVVLYTSLLFHAWKAQGAKAADTQIKTKLQREHEEKMRMEQELADLKAEIERMRAELESKDKSLGSLNSDQDRLQKLLDYLQRRSKAADATIRGLESKADTLEHLGDGSKKLIQSKSHHQFISADKSGSALGASKNAGNESAWAFVDEVQKNDNGEEKKTGNVNVLHANSGNYLSLEESEDGSPSTPHLGDELVSTSAWKIVSHDNEDGSSLVQNTKTGEYLTLGADGKVRVTKDSKDSDASFTIQSKADYDKAQREKLESALIAKSLGGDGEFTFKSAKNQQFVSNDNGKAGLNGAVDSDGNSFWKVLGRDDGSVNLKNRGSGDILGLDKEDESVQLSGEDGVEDDGHSQWWLTRGGENGEELFLRNKATGKLLYVDANGNLITGDSASTDKNKSGSGAGFIVAGAGAGAGAGASSGSGDAGAKDGAFDLGDGFEIGSGYSLAELEGRAASLRDEIDEARRKVAEEERRRQELQRQLDALRHKGEIDAIRADEANKTIAELEKRLAELQALFDLEQGKKTTEQEARANLEKDLSEKELLLQKEAERREKLMRQLQKTQTNAEKEIARRKQRERELADLKAREDKLRKEMELSAKSGGVLDSLKLNLEEHLQDLSAWREFNKLDQKESHFDLKTVAQDMEGKSFEEQMDYLDQKLQNENKCLGRIMKMQDDTHKLDDSVTRQGWLQIKGRRDWKPRWCVLAGHLLRYYNSEDTSEAADGCVDLTVGCDVVRQKALKEGKTKVWPLKLTINTAEEGGEAVVRKLFLRAASKAERHSWFTAISSATTRINYVSECNKSGERPDTRILAFVSAGESSPVHELYVDHRNVTANGMTALRKGLLYHDNIHTLSLQNANVGDEDLEKMCTALDKVTDLRVLRLSGNKFSSSVPHALQAIHAQNKSLRELDLSNNLIDDRAIVELDGLLETNKQLHVLNLSNNIITDTGVETLVNILIKHQSEIPIIMLAHNKISDSGAVKLGELANGNTFVSTLDLSKNRIGDEGAASLAKALKGNLNVHTVDLSGNELGAAGALAWRDCLAVNEDIRSLNLSGNPKLRGSAELASVLDLAGFSIPNLAFQRGFDEGVQAEEATAEDRAGGESSEEEPVAESSKAKAPVAEEDEEDDTEEEEE